MIKKIVIYQTSDDKIFTTYEEAVEYENKQKNKDKNKNTADIVVNPINDNQCGVYGWYNKIEKKWYIGQSVDLKKRYACFTSWAHPYSNKKINIARSKYPDIKYWDYTILEYCPIEHLYDKENFYILNLNSINNGYNIRIGGQKKIDSETSQEMPFRYKGQLFNYLFPKLKFCDGFNNERDYFNWYVKHRKKGWEINYNLLNLNVKKQCISPNTVVMLPPVINHHLFQHNKINETRSNVSLRHNKKGYYATCCKKGKTYMVGPVNTKEEAENLFFEEKVNILKQLSEEYKNEIDDKAYKALISITPEDAKSIYYGTMWTNVI